MGGAEQYDAVMVEYAVGEAVFGMFFLLPMLAYYVFQSLSLQAIAGRRGIRNTWLAWLPIGNLWLLGSISDQYQYLVKGMVNNRRKVLLWLSVATAAMYVLCAFCVLYSGELAYATMSSAALMALLAVVTLLGVMAGIITVAVFQYICYFDLFRSCDPANGVLFLVLSIVFPWTIPFILFAIRKRDGGMPPRKQPIPQPVFTQAPAEVVPVQPEITEDQETEGGTPDEQTIPVADD